MTPPVFQRGVECFEKLTFSSIHLSYLASTASWTGVRSSSAGSSARMGRGMVETEMMVKAVRMDDAMISLERSMVLVSDDDSGQTWGLDSDYILVNELGEDFKTLEIDLCTQLTIGHHRYGWGNKGERAFINLKTAEEAGGRPSVCPP